MASGGQCRRCHRLAEVSLIRCSPAERVPCKRSIGRSNAIGTKCYAAGAGPGASRGTCSTRSNSGNRSCDQSCTSPIGSYKLSQGCEPSSEERSAGNLHATFCGNRGRATASGDPVPRAMTIQMNGMVHVILPVSRFDVARDFYRKLLPQLEMKPVFGGEK